MTALTALACLTHTALPASDASTLKNISTSRLEQKLSETDAELERLASYSLRSGVGSSGYRSKWHETADQPEWVEVDLGGAVSIDDIVLVPTLRRDTKKGVSGRRVPAGVPHRGRNSWRHKRHRDQGSARDL